MTRPVAAHSLIGARIVVESDDDDTSLVFQSINDSIRRLENPRLDVFEFVCECPDAGCVKMMRLSRHEYDSVRAVPGRFAVALGHELPWTEGLVTRCERYLVVERAT